MQQIQTITVSQFVIFAVLLVLPTIYQRTKFALSRQSFYRITLRKKSGLNIHHGHWGFLMVTVFTFLFLLGWRDIVSIGFIGLGFGLVFDEIIPMLLMPSNDRDLELKVYEGSQGATFILIGGIAAFALISFLLFRFFL
jgi:hypothetical protein